MLNKNIKPIITSSLLTLSRNKQTVFAAVCLFLFIAVKFASALGTWREPTVSTGGPVVPLQINTVYTGRQDISGQVGFDNGLTVSGVSQFGKGNPAMNNEYKTSVGSNVLDSDASGAALDVVGNFKVGSLKMLSRIRDKIGQPELYCNNTCQAPTPPPEAYPGHLPPGSGDTGDTCDATHDYNAQYSCPSDSNQQNHATLETCQDIYKPGTSFVIREITCATPDEPDYIIKNNAGKLQISTSTLWAASELTITQDGNVGIANVNPSDKLSVNGTVYTTGGIKFPDGTQTTAMVGGSTPPGMIMYFNRQTCPGGWSVSADSKGRYFVGMKEAVAPNPATTPKGAAGTILSNSFLENRPAGEHAHTVAIGPHTHSSWVYTGGGDHAETYCGDNPCYGSIPTGYGYYVHQSEEASTKIAVGYSSVLPGYDGTYNKMGTPAPYILLLACQKN